MTPWGAVITQLRQWWRRGEYAPVIRFYEDAEIPIKAMITAAALEGGDVMIVEPGTGADRQRRGAHPGARRPPARRAGSSRRAGRPGSSNSRSSTSTSTSWSRCSPSGWRRSASRSSPRSLVKWLRELGFELIEVSPEDAFHLGANAISLGDGRVMSGAGAEALNEAIRAHGLELLDPELDAFTLGGGGAHCLAQALRRERVG